MNVPAHGFLDELAWRGLLHQTTSDALPAYLATAGRVAYAGFDPTADSLTVGNYVPMKLLAHWQRAGHRPIVLMGGGTGLIGDPSGKSAERQLLTPDAVAHNVSRQREIFARVIDFAAKGDRAATVVDNADWLRGLGYIEVLREVGKHFSVNQMIMRDSVRTRLEGREQGISYTEFSYMILQAYDFLHLHRTQQCTVQLGGSDQFGNIVSGIDLVRRHGPVGQAPGHCGSTVDRLAEGENLERPLMADDRRQQHRRRRLGRQRQIDEGGRKQGVLGHHHHVAMQQQGQADTDRPAPDSGHRRLVEIGQGPQEMEYGRVDHLPPALRSDGDEVGDIVAGGEAVALTPEHQHPNGVVRPRAPRRLGQRRIHRLGDGVLLLRPRQGDGQDAACQLGLNLVGHAASSPWIIVHQSTPSASRVRLTRPRCSR
jgi:hypothetical protein